MNRLLLILLLPLAACSENKKEEIRERQKAIKAELKAADDSLIAVRQSDTISVDPQQRPAAAWAEEEKRKPLMQKKEVLQREFDSLERELKKN